MATIDKKSVRNEFDNIKNEFNNLSADKKIPPECKALFKSLILLFELILSIFLEKKTKKTSTNSGKPSSQTEEDNSSLGNKGSKGKGKKEKWKAL